MSLSHGPSIVTSNLVFAYDMANTKKSWKGKPATNTCSFGTYNDGYNSTKISNATPPVPPPVTGYPIYKITSNDGNDAQQILYTATVDQVNGGTYTHSAYVYLEYGTWVSAGQHWNPWDYGTQQYIPNGVWTRIEDPVTNFGNNYGNVALSYNTNGAVYVTGSQYEIGSFASPLVNGTRSNTQAIVDLTGNNTVTVNNLTYASSGTFSFNGSSSWLEMPTSSIFDTQALTMECWCKPTTTSQDGFLFEKGQVNTQYSNFFNSDGTFYFRTIGLSTQDLTFNSASYISTTNWNHIVCTYGSGTKSIYVNGNRIAQQTGLTGSIPTGQLNQYIGKYGSGSNQYPFSGSISVSRVYNRALTAAEVLQNFNARKGLYGV